MNGNVTVNITDDSGYSFPQPAYAITLLRPTPTGYNFQVNIVNSSSLPSTIVQDVQAAITAQFNGTNAAGARVRVGSLLLAATFYGPTATCEGPSVPVQVLSIFLGTSFTGTATLVNGSKVLTVATVAGTGVISPGNVLTGTSISAGTTIVKQLTGTLGKAGTYLMSAQATAIVGSPEAISGIGGTAQLIGVDQQPVIGTITVNLV